MGLPDTDRFKGQYGDSARAGQPDWPATRAAAVTPNDGADLAWPTRSLYVGGAGNVSVDMADAGPAGAPPRPKPSDRSPPPTSRSPAGRACWSASSSMRPRPTSTASTGVPFRSVPSPAAGPAAAPPARSPPSPRTPSPAGPRTW